MQWAIVSLILHVFRPWPPFDIFHLLNNNSLIIYNCHLIKCDLISLLLGNRPFQDNYLFCLYALLVSVFEGLFLCLSELFPTHLKCGRFSF